MLRDVTPEVTNWRSGINCNPSSLEKVLRQVQTELDQYGSSVAVDRRQGAEVAVAAKSLREGDVVCSLGGLVFDTLERLTTFIRTNDCGRDFLGNIVKIDGIQEEDAGSTASFGDGTPQKIRMTSMFFILTGIGR